MHRRQPSAAHAAALLAVTAVACATSRAVNEAGGAVSQPPPFVHGAVVHHRYDGTTDDLLTAGLGKTGLAARAAPAPATPTSPTAEELRRIAIFNNYRALVDVTAAGGYGTFYGPNVDVNGNPTLGEGLIAGDEYLAYDDDGSGRTNVTMMVQVPASFDPAHACIVTGTSSGSRNVYGAIATAGEWGLKHRCAVAYTDKGTGVGAEDLSNDSVDLMQGARADAGLAGKASNFTAPLGSAERVTFAVHDPNRFAFKHAHSKQNAEKDWGRYTLDAVRFAYHVLNQQFGKTAPNGRDKLQTLNPSNTVVIAAGVSNGGGAALAAAEEDGAGLISGVVAGEPQIQLAPDDRRQVLRGGRPVAAQGKTLFDYMSLGNVLEPCAALSAQLADAPGRALPSVFDPVRAAARCSALHVAGILRTETTAAQADEALAALHGAGFENESNPLFATQYAFATPSITVTYAYSYGRFGVQDRLCGYTFAATDSTGAPVPLAPAAEAQLFGTGSGIPPTAGVNLVSDNAVNGPILDASAVSQTTARADYNADGARCLRNLQTGSDGDARAVQGGVREVLRAANIHGKPAILVHGRSDTNVPVNHASRAWMAQNRLVEGAASNARYLEVTNAQHFDTIIDVIPGFATRFIPLQRYFVQAMDLMYAHLTRGGPLPESQVVRTTPRATAAEALTTRNVPPAPLRAAAADAIELRGGALSVPD